MWAAPSEFVSSSIPSWQTLTAHAQSFRGARDLAFCLKVPLDSLLVWASSEGSGETARMRRLAWTFAARIGDKYQIRLARPMYEGHLESGGNSETQSQKQDHVRFSYHCKGLYLFFQWRYFQLISTRLLRYTVCIVKFSTFTTIFNNFGIQKKYLKPKVTLRWISICFALLSVDEWHIRLVHSY